MHRESARRESAVPQKDWWPQGSCPRWAELGIRSAKYTCPVAVILVSKCHMCLELVSQDLETYTYTWPHCSGSWDTSGASGAQAPPSDLDLLPMLVPIPRGSRCHPGAGRSQLRSSPPRGFPRLLAPLHPCPCPASLSQHHRRAVRRLTSCALSPPPGHTHNRSPLALVWVCNATQSAGNWGGNYFKG